MQFFEMIWFIAHFSLSTCVFNIYSLLSSTNNMTLFNNLLHLHPSGKWTRWKHEHEQASFSSGTSCSWWEYMYSRCAVAALGEGILGYLPPSGRLFPRFGENFGFLTLPPCIFPPDPLPPSPQQILVPPLSMCSLYIHVLIVDWWNLWTLLY